MAFKKQSAIFSTLSNKTYSILLNWDKAGGSIRIFRHKTDNQFYASISIYTYFLLKNV